MNVRIPQLAANIDTYFRTSIRGGCLLCSSISGYCKFNKTEMIFMLSWSEHAHLPANTKDPRQTSVVQRIRQIVSGKLLLNACAEIKKCALYGSLDNKLKSLKISGKQVTWFLCFWLSKKRIFFRLSSERGIHDWSAFFP